MSSVGGGQEVAQAPQLAIPDGTQRVPGMYEAVVGANGSSGGTSEGFKPTAIKAANGDAEQRVVGAAEPMDGVEDALQPTEATGAPPEAAGAAAGANEELRAEETLEERAPACDDGVVERRAAEQPALEADEAAVTGQDAAVPCTEGHEANREAELEESAEAAAAELEAAAEAAEAEAGAPPAEGVGDHGEWGPATDGWVGRIGEGRVRVIQPSTGACRHGSNAPTRTNARLWLATHTDWIFASGQRPLTPLSAEQEAALREVAEAVSSASEQGLPLNYKQLANRFASASGKAGDAVTRGPAGVARRPPPQLKRPAERGAVARDGAKEEEPARKSQRRQQQLKSSSLYHHHQPLNPLL